MSLNIIDAAEKIAPTPSRNEPAPAPDRAVWKRQKFALAAAFIAGLAMSPKLWLTERAFPFTPVIPGLPPLPAPLDFIAYALMLVALAAIAIVARPSRWIAVFTGIILILGASDQMRWQPWAYQYLWMLGAFALYSGGALYSRSAISRGLGDRLALNTCRLVVVCTYLWSGIQKMNSEFIDAGFPLLAKPITSHLSPALAQIFNRAGIAAPIIESALAIGLLIPRFRKFAVIGAIAMHSFILLGIGPLGMNWNTVVWPWNLAMIAFVVILFGASSRSVPAMEILWPRRSINSHPDNPRNTWYPKLVLAMLGLIPMLSLVNLWDSYLSSALYTATVNEARIQMKTSFADRLAKPVLQHVYLSKIPGTVQMNLVEWSLADLNVPINPEPRIYKSIGRSVCAAEKQPGEVKLIVYVRPSIVAAGRREEYDCAALAR